MENSGLFFTNLFAEVFSVPTKDYISYELKVWLPYTFKRYILRQDIAKPTPIIEKANTSINEP